MGKILFAEHNGVHALKFIGDVRLTLSPTISTYLEKLETCNAFRSMIIDLTETKTIDSTALGLIAKIGISTRKDFDSTTTIISPNEDITRVLTSMAMEQVCLVVSDAATDEEGMLELPQEVASEETLREQVLEAHKTLMTLNTENFDKFKDLVQALESEQSNDQTKVA